MFFLKKKRFGFEYTEICCSTANQRHSSSRSSFHNLVLFVGRLDNGSRAAHQELGHERWSIFGAHQGEKAKQPALLDQTARILLVSRLFRRSCAQHKQLLVQVVRCRRVLL